MSGDGDVTSTGGASEGIDFMRGIITEMLSALTSVQKGFFFSVRTIPQHLSGTSLLQHVAELFPPASLFAKEICDIPSVWVELRNFLDSRGAGLTQHSSRRVILTLAHGLYEEVEDREAAVETAQLIIAAARRVRSDLRTDERPSAQPSAPVQNNLGGQNGIDRRAHDVGMRLKDSDKKFTGELGESWMDYVDEYQQVALDYNLTPQQKLQFLHNLLAKDAKRFYLERVVTYAQTFQQAVEMIGDE